MAGRAKRFMLASAEGSESGVISRGHGHTLLILNFDVLAPCPGKSHQNLVVLRSKLPQIAEFASPVHPVHFYPGLHGDFRVVLGPRW